MKRGNARVFKCGGGGGGGVVFFFFKQKTAYEIVDCDWSSDGVLFRSLASSAACMSPKRLRFGSVRGCGRSPASNARRQWRDRKSVV